MAVLFALAAAIGWGSSDYAAGHASRKSSAVSVVILTHLASVIALVVIATMPGQTGSPDTADLLWGLAAGLGGGFGAMLLFSGLGKGSMSVVAPITAAGAAMIPVIAGVIQGESLGMFGLFGIVLALGAITMVSLSGDDETDDPTDEETHDGGTSGGGLLLAPAPGLALGPAPAPGGRRSDDDVIAASEREFSSEQVLAAPMAPPSSGWNAPQGAAVAIAAPETVVATSFNELAAAVHMQRDAFEFARLQQRNALQPPVEEVPDLFDRKRSLRRPTQERTAQQPRSMPNVSIGDMVRTMLRRPGVVEALLSGVGFGLFFVFIARTSESAGHWPLVGARLISVVMFAAIAIIGMNAVMPDRQSRPAVVVAGLLDAAAAVFFVLSTRSGLLSVGAVLASLYPAITVLLARFVGKERVTRQQGVGLILAGLAVSMLAL